MFCLNENFCPFLLRRLYTTLLSTVHGDLLPLLRPLRSNTCSRLTISNLLCPNENRHPNNRGEQHVEVAALRHRPVRRRRRRRRSRHEFVPRCQRCARPRPRPLCLRRPIEDLRAPRIVRPRERLVLPAHDAPVRLHRAIRVVAQHKLAQEHERLRRAPLRHLVARAGEEDVGEVALLVHEPRSHPAVVVPRRRGRPREALYRRTTERGVLDDDLGCAVLDVRVVVAGEQHERDAARGGVREERGEEGDGRGGGVAVRRVAGREVVGGAEGVREVLRPGLGGGRVQSGAHGGLVEEGRGVERRLGVRRVGDVIVVRAAVRCRCVCVCEY